MLLPAVADDEATAWWPRHPFEFSFLYAHKRNPPASSVGEDSILEGARDESASVHTQARGVLESPVGTQAHVMRAVFRVIKRMSFMVPPLAVRAGAIASGAGGAERDGSTNHRFGRGE
jgi:hypothetical protein